MNKIVEITQSHTETQGSSWKMTKDVLFGMNK